MGTVNFFQEAISFQKSVTYNQARIELWDMYDYGKITSEQLFKGLQVSTYVRNHNLSGMEILNKLNK